MRCVAVCRSTRKVQNDVHHLGCSSPPQSQDEFNMWTSVNAAAPGQSPTFECTSSPLEERVASHKVCHCHFKSVICSTRQLPSHDEYQVMFC